MARTVAGRIAEIANSELPYKEPLHPYTQALLSAVPNSDPTVEAEGEYIILQGKEPRPLNPASGCAFHRRCPRTTDLCREAVPVFGEKPPGHWRPAITLSEIPDFLPFHRAIFSGKAENSWGSFVLTWFFMLG